MNTKDRILDAAERLFARDGIEATSLRTITTEAGVNLAAVNYHFQTKEALIHAVVARRLRPVNERRVAMLDECERKAGGGPLPLHEVVDAFVRPVLEIHAGRGKEITPLMGRLYSEPGEFIQKVFKDHLEPVALRFISAFRRALPELPKAELLWRLHFCFGAVAHTLGAGKLLRLLSEGECDPSDVEVTLGHLEAFMIAGLSAPIPAEVEHASR